jgi:hypothetical protein
MDNRKIIDHITRQLVDLQNGKLWMGDNFQTKIKSISREESFTKPSPGMHSVAQLLAHLTAWNNDIVMKINTGKGQLKDEHENNWPDNTKLEKIGWNNIVNDFQNSLFNEIDLLRTKDDSFLKQRYYDQDFNGEFDYLFAIEGMLHHQIYHLGQIGIVIKLIKRK